MLCYSFRSHTHCHLRHVRELQYCKLMAQHNQIISKRLSFTNIIFLIHRGRNRFRAKLHEAILCDMWRGVMNRLIKYIALIYSANTISRVGEKKRRHIKVKMGQ